MAWQDDDKRKDKDPWTGDEDRESPPDLEQAIRRLFKNLKKPNPSEERESLFKNGGGNGGSNTSDDDNNGSLYAFSGMIFIVLLILWAISGIFIVAPAQKAVVLRFGQYNKTVGPGPHWIPRFVDERYIISVEDIMDYQYNAEMLTRDENIVSVGIAVQYRIGNAENYLFKVVDPKESLSQITTSVLRQVIGDKLLDEVLNYGQDRTDKTVNSAMGQDIKRSITELLNRYQTGFLVTDVAIQFIKPPKAVIEAFDDVIIASEDRARYRSEAYADEQKIVLEAEGVAQRIIEESKGVAQSHIALAKEKTAEFLGELPQYLMTPKITRERLYLDTMSNILGKNPKLFITAKDNNSMMYLPLDKMLGQSSIPRETVSADGQSINLPRYTPSSPPEVRSSTRETRSLNGRGQ